MKSSTQDNAEGKMHQAKGKIKEVVGKIAGNRDLEAEGKGEVLWPLRVALTGQEKSPDPFVSAAILGREESLRRIDIALKKIA